MHEARTVRYTGNPALAGAVAASLREEGVEVRYDPPIEARGREQMAEAVAVYYFLKGSDAAIRLALWKFRERFGKHGKIEEVDK